MADSNSSNPPGLSCQDVDFLMGNRRLGSFIVAVHSDSMAPRFNDGEYALIEPSSEADINDDVLVRLRSGETLLKRLLGLAGGVRLGSYNSDDVLVYPFNEIVWIYHVSHALPARKIRMWVDPVAEQAVTSLHRLTDLRRHYARTTLPSMGITFERGMQHAMVRIVVEGAAAAEKRRRDIESTRTAD